MLGLASSSDNIHAMAIYTELYNMLRSADCDFVVNALILIAMTDTHVSKLLAR
jgi:hypothetical protein